LNEADRGPQVALNADQLRLNTSQPLRTQEKFALVPIRTTPYLHQEERALVRDFEMTCYYVAPNFGAAWFSAKFFARFFEILSILGA
jgi:hypothetical protein